MSAFFLFLGAKVTAEEQKEEQIPEREKTELELLHEDAQDGEILSEDELIKLGFEYCGNNIIQSVRKNGVEISFYGGHLCDIKIDGKDIEEMEFNIPPAGDDLCYRINSEALIFAYQKAGII